MTGQTSQNLSQWRGNDSDSSWPRTSDDSWVHERQLLGILPFSKKKKRGGLQKPWFGVMLWKKKKKGNSNGFFVCFLGSFSLLQLHSTASDQFKAMFVLFSVYTPGAIDVVMMILISRTSSWQKRTKNLTQKKRGQLWAFRKGLQYGDRVFPGRLKFRHGIDGDFFNLVFLAVYAAERRLQLSYECLQSLVRCGSPYIQVLVGHGQCLSMLIIYCKISKALLLTQLLIEMFLLRDLFVDYHGIR